jgi:hypothetical protein
VNGSKVAGSTFGGIAGRVLRGTLSAGTFLSGFTLVFILAILSIMLRQFTEGNIQALLVQIGVAVALARFATNGLAGEWGGTIYSTRGGSWLDALRVAFRFSTLSSVWLAPVLLLGWRPAVVGSAIGEMMMGGKAGLMLSLTTLVVALAALTPPIFLIVSVGAHNSADIVSPRHWRRLFSGRAGDLFLVYAVYLGGLGMTVLCLLPLFTAVAFQNRDLALFLGFFALAFIAGMSLDLLGRLSGFFAAGSEGLMRPIPVAAIEVPANPIGSPHPHAPAGEAMVPATDSFHAEVHPGLMTTHSPSRETPSGVHLTEANPSRTAATPSGKAPLLDAREHVDELERRLTVDPEGALAALAELHESYAPNPLIMHRLCIALATHGHRAESLELAREAIPLCLERGALRLAAEIFAQHQDRPDAFPLNRDTVINLAQDMRRHGDLAAAEHAFRNVIDRDRGERRAVKGIIQIAEDQLQLSEYAEAQRLFRFLLDHCGDSPLAVHIQDGLAEAERRLAKAS